MKDSFDLYSALINEMERMEKNYISASESLKKYKDEFPNKEYLEGLNDGTIATIKFLKKLIEVYKD